MFNVGDRVKYIGTDYNFDDLGVEVVGGTISQISNPIGWGNLYFVDFPVSKETLCCYDHELERIT